MVAVPGFYSQKRSTTKPHVTETRPEVGGVAGEGSRVMEEVTVEQNLDTSDSTFSTHSIEKTDTFNAPIYSGNVYSKNKGQDLNTPPHNLDQFNAKNLGSNQHRKIGASSQTNPTNPIGITLINILSKCSNNNEFLEVAHANPNAHMSILNPLSREGHEFTRSTKKKKWHMGKAGQRQAYTIGCSSRSIGLCKRKFSTVNDHPELPCNKKQVLKDDAEFSSQMVEAVEQPCQEP